MLGVDHRLDDAGVAALCGDGVEVLVHGDRIRGHLLRGGIVPLADHFDRVPFLARSLEDLLDALVAVTIDGRARDAADFKHPAALGDVLHEIFRPVLAEPLLVDVDVDRLLGIEDVVERHQHDARIVGALDHRLERRRILGVHHDGIVA